MKSSKKVLAFALAAAMVVTAVPATNAQAASTAKLNATKATVYAGSTKTLTVKAPKSWKNVKVTKVSTSKKSVATVKKTATKKVKVTAVKAGTAKVTVKVTYKKSAKKNAKTYTKNLTSKITVKNPTIKVTSDSEIAIGTTTQVKATVKPSTAKVTYTTSDEKIATVDATSGIVTGVATGDVTITATAKNGKKTVTAEQKISVKKAILKEAKQTKYNAIEAVIVGDTKELKAGDFKITNTATNATVAVKAVNAKKNAADTFTIETFTDMTDAKEYSVEYAGSKATFVATDNTVATVGVTTTEIAAASLTEIKATTSDKNGVILSETALDSSDSSKGKVTSEVKFTKGYQDGSKLYLPAVGDTATIKVTYHTGTFATDGKESGNIENTFTVKAIDPSLVNLTYAVTIDSSAPAWKANSFKANNQVKIGDVRKAFFRITKDDGNDIDNYSDYKVETADRTKLLVAEGTLTDNATSVDVNGVSEGTTYILIKKDDKTVASLPVVVVGKPVATSLDLNKTSATVVLTKNVTESVKATIKDQYKDDMATDSVKVTLLGQPKDAKIGGTAFSVNDDVTAQFTISPDNRTVEFTGIKFDKKGTYTFKISSKNGDKTLDRTFTVNAVDTATKAQSYEVKVDNAEVDTTINKNGDMPADITVKVAAMANGGALAYVDATDIKYVVKKGTDTVYETGVKTSAAINAGRNTAEDLTVHPVSNGGIYFDKQLAAGTYNVTATFYVNDAGNTAATASTGYKKVTVGGSFTIKDTQDSKVTFHIEKNDTTGTVASAFADQNYVKVYYDGQLQTIESSDVIEVKGTALTGGGAFVTTVKLYVTVSGSNGTVKVPVTVNVNDQFKNCSGLK